MLKSLKLKMNKLRSKKNYKTTTVVSILGTDIPIDLKVEAINKSEAEKVSQYHIAQNMKITTEKINRIKK